MSHTFDMDVVPFGNLGWPPIVYITIKNRSENSLGHTCVSPECHSAQEFEYEIERLQAELREVRTRGIKAFAKPTKYAEVRTTLGGGTL